MNWLDVVISIILGYFLLKGLTRGIVREVVDISAVVLTLILAGRYGSLVGEQITVGFGWDPALSGLLGFVAIAIGVAIVASVINFLWSKLGSLTPLSLFDKVGGAVVGAAKAVILILILLVVMTSLPIQGSAESIAESGLAQSFLGTLPAIYRILDPVWPEEWPRLYVTPEGWWLQEEHVLITVTEEV